MKETRHEGSGHYVLLGGSGRRNRLAEVLRGRVLGGDYSFVAEDVGGSVWRQYSTEETATN